MFNIVHGYLVTSNFSERVLRESSFLMFRCQVPVAGFSSNRHAHWTNS